MYNNDMNDAKLLRSEKLNKRIVELDVLRGICVLLMVLDHIAVDFWYFAPSFFENFPGNSKFFGSLYDVSLLYWDHPARLIIRIVVVFLFMMLVGISSTFSRSNLKRGIKLLIVSLILTIGSFALAHIIGDYDIVILFGTLHAISVSLLILSLFEIFIHNKWFYLITGLIMYGVGLFINIEIMEYRAYTLNNMFDLFFKTILGTIQGGGDSSGIFLVLGPSFIGYFIGLALYSEKKSIFNAKYSNNPITFIGRNALIIYLLHQVVLVLLVSLLLLICGYKLNLGF